MKGIKIPSHRKLSGVKQADLCKALGLTPQTLVDIELGRVDISPKWHAEIMEQIDRLAQERQPTISQ